MSFGLIITPQAQGHIDAGYIWYENQELGLGEKFFDILDMYFDRIITLPASHPAKYDTIRVATIKEFPYLIIYEIVDSDIVVYSVFHTAQHPKQRFDR